MYHRFKFNIHDSRTNSAAKSSHISQYLAHNSILILFSFSVSFAEEKMRFKVNFVKNLSCPVGIIAYISFVHFTEGQVPALEEPFPGSHGPELPKATPSPYRGCPAECNKRLSDAMALIGN